MEQASCLPPSRDSRPTVAGGLRSSLPSSHPLRAADISWAGNFPVLGRAPIFRKRGSAVKTVRTLVRYARFGAWSWRLSG